MIMVEEERRGLKGTPRRKPPMWIRLKSQRQERLKSQRQERLKSQRQERPKVQRQELPKSQKQVQRLAGSQRRQVGSQRRQVESQEPRQSLTQTHSGPSATPDEMDLVGR